MRKLFGILFVAVAAMCMFAGCSNDEDQQVAMSKEQQFENNLKALRYTQESIVNSVYTRTNEEADTLSDEELLKLGQDLDSITAIFLYENAEYLAESMPEWDLSDEELDELVFDDEAFRTFLSTYFSVAFCEEAEAFIWDEETRSSSSTTSATSSLTPFEKVIVSNMQVVSKVDNSDMQMIDPNQTKVSCLQAYNEAHDLCQLQYVRNLVQECKTWIIDCSAAGGVIGATAGTAGAGGLGTAGGAWAGTKLGAAVGWLGANIVAGTQKAECVLKAKSEKRKCLANAK